MTWRKKAVIVDEEAIKKELHLRSVDREIYKIRKALNYLPIHKQQLEATLEKWEEHRKGLTP